MYYTYYEPTCWLVLARAFNFVPRSTIFWAEKIIVDIAIIQGKYLLLCVAITIIVVCSVDSKCHDHFTIFYFLLLTTISKNHFLRSIITPLQATHYYVSNNYALLSRVSGRFFYCFSLMHLASQNDYAAIIDHFELGNDRRHAFTIIPTSCSASLRSRS